MISEEASKPVAVAVVQGAAFVASDRHDLPEPVPVPEVAVVAAAAAQDGSRADLGRIARPDATSACP